MSELLAAAGSAPWASGLTPLAVLLVGKGSLVVLAGILASYSMHRSTAASRHLIWTATLSGLLILPVLEAVSPSVALPLLPRAQQSGVQAGEETVASPAATPRPKVGTRPETIAPSVPGKPANPFSVLATIYLAGFLATLVYFAAGTIAVRRLTEAAESPPESEGWRSLLGPRSGLLAGGSSPRFLVSRSLRAPVVWGFLEPVVLFPVEANAWSPRDLRHAMLHELAHVERRDWAAAFLARLACCVYWFHPLVWLAARQQTLEAERACDDRVLAAGADSSEYASQLLNLVRALRAGVPGFKVAVSMASPSHLQQRIQSILDPERRRNPMKRNARRFVFVLACLPAVLMSTVTLVPAVAEETPAVAREEKTPTPPLIRAAARGELEEVQALIEAGADVNRVGPGENQHLGQLRTALATASRAGHVEIVRVLLDSGAEVDRAPAGDATALIEAAGKGHLEIVQLLLDSRADPDLLVPGDGTPLIAASRSGSSEVVDLLIAAGADPDRSVAQDGNPVLNAAASGSAEALEALAASGADVNAELPGDGSPLIVAARGGHLEAARALLDSGAAVDAGFEGDGNAMIRAAAIGDAELLRLLIESGADVDAEVSGDGNPLIAASQGGHIEAVRQLVESGADIERIVPGDENALIQAAAAGRIEVVEYLIAQGADVNARVVANGSEIRTPLSQARRGRHTEVVDLLLAAGAQG